jgi:predicted SprT family Zn-dependent metalloprotease
MTDYRERRLYVFTCDGCGKKKSTTIKRRRAREKKCRACRKKLKNFNPDQAELFPQPEN